MQENEAIYFELDYIDYQSIRPLRAILFIYGVTDYDYYLPYRLNLYNNHRIKKNS